LPYKIEYKSSVSRDLKKLDRGVANLQRIENELGKDPDCGEPLSGQFKGLFKYRVRVYHVVYTKTDEGSF
jgi:hypothetical protein